MIRRNTIASEILRSDDKAFFEEFLRPGEYIASIAVPTRHNPSYAIYSDKAVYVISKDLKTVEVVEYGWQ